MLVFEDSYVEGIGADSPATGFAPLAAGMLGWSVQLFGKGGCGFVNPGPRHNQTYLQRIDELVLDAERDVIFIEGGINDRRLPGVTPAAIGVITELQTRVPGAKLGISTWPRCWSPSFAH